MGNRLKEIWSGFEAETSRKLTGEGVGNIPVPDRAEFSRRNEDPLLPEGMEAPTEAAFTALRDKLEAHEKKFGKKKRGRARRAFAQEEITPDMATASFDGEELIKGLQATAMRTERSELDYGTFMTSDEGKAALKRLSKKKKFFGLF